MKSFNPAATSFDLTNALRMAELSKLAYESHEKARAILTGPEWGFTQFQGFEVEDTEAFLAADAEKIVLSFRGSVSKTDWDTDFKIKLVDSKTVGRVHNGFQKALNHVWDNLYDTLLSWKGREQTLWITGHSLGGALATLAANRITEERIDVAGVYTFGQPMVGDARFAANFERKLKGRMYRFRNDEDLVTKFTGFFYRHVGEECFFDNKGRLFRGNTWWKKFVSRAESVALRSSDKASETRATNPGGLRDHSMLTYIRYLGEELYREHGETGTFTEYINRKKVA